MSCCIEATQDISADTIFDHVFDQMFADFWHKECIRRLPGPSSRFLAGVTLVHIGIFGEEYLLEAYYEKDL